MNTIKDLAIKWWEDLSNREKAKLTFYFDAGRRWEWLFEAEIESIFYQEVIIKWFSSKTYHEQHELSDLYFDSRNPSLFTAEQVKEIYLKEHSKEEPKAIEDNVWDEVERILYNHDQPIGTKIAMLKAKFTLTKKQ